jgi:8-oxo-dGTP pyrophosphatase MutT (NUDIX family)
LSDATPAGAALVLAAGGVVWRRGEAGGLEVIVVHRPRYDDWSLPKGKLDPGETDEQAALREVEEETGVVAELGPELPTTTYLDRSGKHKRVRYWAMTVVSGDPGPANEVDQAEWVGLEEAGRRLSYQRDAAVLEALPGVVAGSAG